MFSQQKAWATTASVIVLAALTVAIVVFAAPGGSGAIDGNTITTVDSDVRVGKENSIGIGTDGFPIISYRHGINADLMVAHCGNLTCTSGNSITALDSEGTAGFATSLAIGSDDLPVISYRNGTTVLAAHCGNAACTAGNTLNTVDGPSQSLGLSTALAIGSDDLPILSYYDGTFVDTSIRTAHCGDVSCGSGNTITLHDVGDGGLGISIAVGTDGLPIISYRSAGNGSLKVLHCGNVLCSAGDTITQVGTDQTLTTSTSIAIGTDGLPVIAYYSSNQDQGLKLAHCGNVECSAGNTISVVDGGFGAWPSVAVGTDGLPVIGYQQGSGALKVAHCGDSSCSSGNVFANVDAASFPAHSNITIGSDGLPVVSYYGNVRLKVAHCGDIACGAFKPTPTPTATNTPTGHDPAVTSLDIPTWPPLPFPAEETKKVSGTIQNLGTVKDSYTVMLTLEFGFDLNADWLAEPGDSVLQNGPFCSGKYPSCSVLEFSVTGIQPGAMFPVSRNLRMACPAPTPFVTQFFAVTLSADDIHGMDSNPSNSSQDAFDGIQCPGPKTATPEPATPTPEPVGGIAELVDADATPVLSEDGSARPNAWLFVAVAALIAASAGGAALWARR